MEGRCGSCKHWESINQEAEDYEYIFYDKAGRAMNIGYCGARRGPAVVGRGKIEVRAPVTPDWESCRLYEPKDDN